VYSAESQMKGPTRGAIAPCGFERSDFHRMGVALVVREARQQPGAQHQHHDDRKSASDDGAEGLRNARGLQCQVERPEFTATSQQDLVDAHRLTEANDAGGRIVVLTR
jgi:hypothetical protein